MSPGSSAEVVMVRAREDEALSSPWSCVTDAAARGEMKDGRSPASSFLRGGSILLPTARAPLPADGPSQLVSANRVAQAAASLRVVRLVRLLRLLRTPGCCVGEAAAPFGATSGADLVDAMVDQVAPFFLFGGMILMDLFHRYSRMFHDIRCLLQVLAPVYF